MIATSSISECLSEASNPEDGSLREAVIQGLRGSGYSSLSNIKCEVSGGTVVIFGVVPSFYLKQMAQAIVLRMGQIGVKNDLLVRAPEPPCDYEAA